MCTFIPKWFKGYDARVHYRPLLKTETLGL